MTNKINGIDVSECKNFSCGICEEENKIPRTIGHFTADCILYPNCYYKQLKRLQKENEELKASLKTLDDEVLTVEITLDEFEKIKKYKQALEEIRKEANRLLYELNPIYGYNNSNHFEILAKYVLAKTKEVLNDRD